MSVEDFQNVKDWAHQQWGSAALGDKRRTNRAVHLGALLAARPGDSLPQQTNSWAELKAAYRLLNEPDVTHTALTEDHCRQTAEQASSPSQPVCLFIQDTSELNFTHHPATTHLGHIGDGKGRGFMLHTCLAVIPDEDNPEVIGMAAQRVWTRQTIYRSFEKRSQRYHRRTEAEVWAEVVEQIGRAPDQPKGGLWVSVGDSASDVFSYLRRSLKLGWHCLVRVCKNRKVKTAQDETVDLKTWARNLSARVCKQVQLRGRDGQAGRTVRLQIGWGEVRLCAPQVGPERKAEPIKGWGVRCWEQSDRQEAIEWILFTTLEVEEADEALKYVEWYSTRWVIEEYHKCLKTGCAMEARQLTTGGGLKALLGFLAIVALRLLELRTMARRSPHQAAKGNVPERMLGTVKSKLGIGKQELTMQEFWHALARLGGFIGRRADGEPGWQSLWRGWQRLQDLCWGVDPE